MAGVILGWAILGMLGLFIIRGCSWSLIDNIKKEGWIETFMPLIILITFGSLLILGIWLASKGTWWN